MENTSLIHYDITKRIIRAYYNVFNELGFGFLEKVYVNALIIELESLGFSIQVNVPLDVFYKQINVGRYFPDIIVNSCVIIEVKAAKSLCEEHEWQLINYLKASQMEVGILLNFGKEPEFRRKIYNR